MDFFDGKQNLHFIGVGGSGMFPLVQIMMGRGFSISGSDNNETDTLALEREMGVRVFMGHSPDNIKDADVVIYSAAIMEDNPELLAAREAGIPVLERSAALGWLTRQYSDCICVSGTHGKTSTTAMLTQILLKAELDITAFIGGKLPFMGGSGRSGSTSIMTCEACEFKDTFLQLAPDIAVILNVDEDHMDYFGTMDNLRRSFRRFAEMTTKCLIVNGDDAQSMAVVKGLDKKIITFGMSEGCDFRAVNLSPLTPVGARFDLVRRGETLCTIDLAVVGAHNVLNAVAACAAALEAGALPAQLAPGLAEFHGAGRRFEVLGNVRGVTIADDYAHHPKELAVTLEAAMELGFNRVWAVFQPFTYSRTYNLLDDFAKALSIPDRVVMSEIMGGREHNTQGIYTRDLAEKIPGAVWFPAFPEIAAYVMERAEDGDLVITMGCGDIYKCAKMMLNM